MKHTYNSGEAVKKAKKLGDEVVAALVKKGILNAICKLDNTGHYGIFFKFDDDEAHALSILDAWAGLGFSREATGGVSIRYRTVYIGCGGRPVCNGLTLSKKLPPVESIVNNLKLRHAKIEVAHLDHVQSNLAERVFNLESKSLQKEFPRFKANIGGEPDEGSCVHSIHFDEISIGRARQILEILTKYLPEHYEVGEDS